MLAPAQVRGRRTQWQKKRTPLPPGPPGNGIPLPPGPPGKRTPLPPTHTQAPTHVCRHEADYVPIVDPDEGNLVSILGYLDVVHLLDQAAKQVGQPAPI